MQTEERNHRQFNMVAANDLCLHRGFRLPILANESAAGSALSADAIVGGSRIGSLLAENLQFTTATSFWRVAEASAAEGTLNNVQVAEDRHQWATFQVNK